MVEPLYSIPVRLSRTLLIALLLALLGFAAQPIEPVQAAWLPDCTPVTGDLTVLGLSENATGQAQCLSLQSIYVNLGGDSWSHGAQPGPEADDWGELTNVGTWWGVGLSATGYVISVQLSGSNLVGNIQDIDLSGLPRLSHFHMHHNQISGNIEGLDVSSNPLLERIDLNTNQIGGSIQNFDLTNNPAFMELDLSSNQIGGSIDGFDVTNNPDLWMLYLDDNQIGGSIQNFDLSANTDIWYANLNNNQIGGLIEGFDVSSNLDLYWIGLGNNQIGGNISSFDLSGNPNMARLELNNNQITGTLPAWMDGSSAGPLGMLNLSYNLCLRPSGIPAVDTFVTTRDPDWQTTNTGCNLAAIAACNGANLDVTITAGDPNFNITGTGTGLPQTVGLGTHSLTGPDTWTGVTVNELTGDTETSFLGDFTCAGAPEMDVQRPAGTSIADGGTDNVGVHPVGPTSLTYTIANTGTADLTFTLTAITSPVNTSGFVFTIPPPPTIPGGTSATMQIGFNIDAPGAFSFDLGFLNNDADENPYDIHVVGTTAVTALAALAACNGSDLEVNLTAGDNPFDITGTGPNLPQNGVGTGITTLTGPGSWTGVTVTETTGDTESDNLGDFTCGPEIDVQRPAGTSIADGGNDAVGAQPVGSMALTYTIDNTAGSADLTIPAGGVTATNFTNVSGFTVNTGLPLTVAAGNTATLQIQFNIDAAGAFSFDLDITSNDADESPYDIAVSGTGTNNLAATAACNGSDLDVNITAGDNPFNITGTSGPNLPQNGVGTGITTLTGPGSWTGVTVEETAGDTESANLGNYTCPIPVTSSSSGGGGAAQTTGCNVTIDVEADREVVNWGDQVVWTVLVTNNGSAECQGVQTYGTMPGEFSITDITPSRGSLTWDGGQYYRVELGTLAVGEQVTVSIDSLLQSGAGFMLPEGAAGQSAGQQICLTGYITDPVNDTDCVTLFPDTLPSTGGEPVEQAPNWGWVVAAGLLIAGLGGYVLQRQKA